MYYVEWLEIGKCVTMNSYKNHIIAWNSNLFKQTINSKWRTKNTYIRSLFALFFFRGDSSKGSKSCHSPCLVLKVLNYSSLGVHMAGVVGMVSHLFLLSQFSF